MNATSPPTSQLRWIQVRMSLTGPRAIAFPLGGEMSLDIWLPLQYSLSYDFDAAWRGLKWCLLPPPLAVVTAFDRRPIKIVEDKEGLGFNAGRRCVKCSVLCDDEWSDFTTELTNAVLIVLEFPCAKKTVLVLEKAPLFDARGKLDENSVVSILVPILLAPLCRWCPCVVLMSRFSSDAFLWVWGNGCLGFFLLSVLGVSACFNGLSPCFLVWLCFWVRVKSS